MMGEALRIFTNGRGLAILLPFEATIRKGCPFLPVHRERGYHMKYWKVTDYREGVLVCGTYTTKAKANAACKKFAADTDGDCNLDITEHETAEGKSLKYPDIDRW